MTRVLKWNKSAIKKRGAGNWNPINAAGGERWPRCDVTMEHRSAPLIAFRPGFHSPVWRGMKGRTQECVWTHGRIPEPRCTSEHTGYYGEFWMLKPFHKNKKIAKRATTSQMMSFRNPKQALLVTVSHRDRCPWVVGGQAPSMLHWFLSHYLQC